MRLEIEQKNPYNGKQERHYLAVVRTGGKVHALLLEELYPLAFRADGFGELCDKIKENGWTVRTVQEA